MLRTLALAGSLVAALLTGSPTATATAVRETMPAQRAQGMRAELEAIPGMRVTDASRFDGGTVFRLTYRQPVDHSHPAAGSFRQRLVLIHVGRSAPTVLQTTGYDLPFKPEISEVTTLLGANQVSVEQRYFLPSRPNPALWEHMTIAQAAADHHRIVAALKPIYAASWISTGASKGGMTSVYHRRFYPDDVDGTVAYVAPNDVDNARDSYVEFIQHAGTNASCNRALRVVQRQLLLRRERMLVLLREYLASRRLSVDETFGSVNRSFEAAVLDMPFAFWQYGTQGGCRQVPAGDGSDRRLFDFVDRISSWFYYTDEEIRPYETYYYQASTQLGWPNTSDAPHVAGLLDYRQAGAAPAYTPRSIRPTFFDADAMADVDRWVRHSGVRLLFVYGENDPWSAEPFQLGRGSAHSAVLWEPAGNHGASIAGLRRMDRRLAEDKLYRWAGVSPAVARPVPEGMQREVDLRMRRTAGAPSASPAGSAAAPTCFGRPATIVGTPGRDTIEGTDGPDVVVTGDGFDVVHGRAGNDRICTGRGGDRLYGGGGRDRLAAGPDGFLPDDDDITADFLVGGPGNDLLNGGPGLRADRPGRGDRVSYGGSPERVRLNLAAGVATIGRSRDVLVSIEDVTGSPQADMLTGDGHENDLDGGEGADILRGMGAFDRLDGGVGNDEADGGLAYDIIFGGDGEDRLLGGPGDDEIYGDDGDDRMAGGEGDDRLYGDIGFDRADGGPHVRFDFCRAETVTTCEL